VSFDVVSNPEFLREGDAVNDFMKPDRVVVGTSSPKAAEIMRELYLPFVRQGNPILFMDEASSELTKYAANAFLATKISFMNEIANMCEMLGADVDMVRLGIGSDDRIGKRFLFAGVGYGGSCFPKDVDALKRTSEQIGYDFKILGAVKEANVFQRKSFFKKINEFYSKDLKGKKFAIWGLAFKPNTDDIREAPSLYIIKKLLEAGAEVSAYDPEAMNNVKKVLKNKIHYAENPYDCLNNADALVIMTEWSIFRTPDFQLIKSDIKDKVIFDGRNLYEVNKIKQLGLKYFSIGRNSI
jgi:UDPglucose 6-dehydrogenase